MTIRSQPLQLSVKDIADAIQRPGERLEAVIDKVRFWSDQGLIHQVGERNPGKGRARRYNGENLLEAGLLEVLTNVVAMPAVLAAPYMRAIKKLIAEDWANALRSGQPVPAITVAPADRPFLVISKLHGKSGTTVARLAAKDLSQHHMRPQTQRYDAHITIDLQLMFERLLSPLEEV
jgi:hypothetical protein